MMFWLAILAGVAFAVIGIKKHFDSMWIILFNILIAIYLSIMLTPTIIGLISDVKDMGYNRAICVVGIATIVFAILHTIVVNYIIDLDEISFPKLFSNIGTGSLGFLAGYIVCSFFFFVIGIMPFTKHQLVKDIFGNDGIAPTAVRSVEKVCNFVGAASLQADNSANAKIIDWLTLNKTPLADTNSVDKPQETSAE